MRHLAERWFFRHLAETLVLVVPRKDVRSCGTLKRLLVAPCETLVLAVLRRDMSSRGTLKRRWFLQCLAEMLVLVGKRGRREHGGVGGASSPKVCLVTRDWAFPLKALGLRVIHYLATPTKVRFGRLGVVARCVGG